MTVPPGYTMQAEISERYAETAVIECDRCKVNVAAGPLDLQAVVLAVWDHETAIHPRRT